MVLENEVSNAGECLLGFCLRVLCELSDNIIQILLQLLVNEAAVSSHPLWNTNEEKL